jgi:assimilatory nitrate reductase catalytic subunit
LLFRAADDVAPTAELVQEIEKLFGIAGAAVLRYDDQRRGTGRHIAIRDGQLQAVALTGDISAESWLKPYLMEQEPVAKLGRLLLMPGRIRHKVFRQKAK